MVAKLINIIIGGLILWGVYHLHFRLLPRLVTNYRRVRKEHTKTEKAIKEIRKTK